MEEIPRQVVEYYQHKGIKAKDDDEDEVKSPNQNNISENIVNESSSTSANNNF